jgi:hypothetical protein
MEGSKVIVVPALPQDVAGAVTFWRLAGSVDHARLEGEWRARGLDPRLLPSLPTPAVALHRAIEERREERRLVRPLPKRAGWAIVAERARGEDDLAYHVETRARLDDVGRLVVEPADSDDARVLAAQFDTHLRTLSFGDVGGWLARRVYALRATALRATGGVYFVPRPSVEEWTLTGQALAAASGCFVHQIPALRTSEAVEAILEAVAQETQAEAKRMEEQIADLGGRGLRARLDECEAVEAKVTFYEDLLGRKATDLHDRLEHLKASIAAALLASSGDDDQVALDDLTAAP